MIYLKTVENKVQAFGYPVQNFEVAVEDYEWEKNCQNNDNKIVDGVFYPHHIDTRSYREKREAEYPTIGDMIDAFCKAKSGDESELNLLLEKRQEIKNKYPKV